MRDALKSGRRHLIQYSTNPRRIAIKNRTISVLLWASEECSLWMFQVDINSVGLNNYLEIGSTPKVPKSRNLVMGIGLLHLFSLCRDFFLGHKYLGSDLEILKKTMNVRTYFATAQYNLFSGKMDAGRELN